MWIESCDIPDNTFSGLDLQLPNELRDEVVKETQDELINCFIESLDISWGSERLSSIFKTTLRDFWNQEFYLLNTLDANYIREVLGESLNRLQDDNPDEYERLRWDISQSYIIINGVSINFHNEFTYYAPKTSPTPLSRPDDIGYMITLHEELKENQFEKLRDEWFSPEIIDFIENDIFKKMCGEEYECTSESIYNLKNLALFVINIETASGTKLSNWSSSASWYFHILNQNGRNTDKNDDKIPDWNTIDLALRHWAKYYNSPHSDSIGLSQYTVFDVKNLDINITPKANWVKRIWNRNDNNWEWRPGSDYTFDDQFRVFLMRCMYLEPTALKNILLWNNQIVAAEAIYRVHHGNIYHDVNKLEGDRNTLTLMNRWLREYY